MKLKHEVLEDLATRGGNVARFISFEPCSDTPTMVHHRVNNNNDYYFYKGAGLLKSFVTEIILEMIEEVGRINIRSFKPGQMKGNEMLFNKSAEDIDEIIDKLYRNAEDGFYSIVNENIDIMDGGVSGVIFNNVIEFAPGDTPKCVEKPGVCSLPLDIGIEVLKTIYDVDLKKELKKTGLDKENIRVEFSIHPMPVGLGKENVIFWEYEKYESDYETQARLVMPNRFSEFIGDKTFGLLVLDALGISVPKTIAVGRNINPFVFGQETGSPTKWLRTAPSVKLGGYYETERGARDIYEFLDRAEKEGNADEIHTILSQNEVDVVFSGAIIIAEKYVKVETVTGFGDDFMSGKEEPDNKEGDITKALEHIKSHREKIFDLFGSSTIEFGYSKKGKFWVFQVNPLKDFSTKENVIVDGNFENPIEFDVKHGLEELRVLIDGIRENESIILIGNVGVTSHFGDILRQAGVPSKIR